MKIVKAIYLDLIDDSGVCTANVFVGFPVKFLHVKGVYYTPNEFVANVFAGSILTSTISDNQPLAIVDIGGTTIDGIQDVLIEFSTEKTIQGQYVFEFHSSDGTLAPTADGDKCYLIVEMYDTNSYPPSVSRIGLPPVGQYSTL